MRCGLQSRCPVPDNSAGTYLTTLNGTAMRMLTMTRHIQARFRETIIHPKPHPPMHTAAAISCPGSYTNKTLLVISPLWAWHKRYGIPLAVLILWQSFVGIYPGQLIAAAV